MNELEEVGKRWMINFVVCLDDGSYEINFCGRPHFVPQTVGPGDSKFEFLQPRLQLRPGQKHAFKHDLPSDLSEVDY